MAEVTLEFLAKQIERVLVDVASTREDVNVLTAIVMRQDTTMAALLTEIRGVHAQISRVQQRLAKLEKEPT